MVNERVLLVNTPNVGGVAANSGAFPAMGVVSLATRLQKDYPGLEVSVVDGGLRTSESIIGEIDRVKPGIIGISVLTPTYVEGLRLGQYAKGGYGSTVVLGNDHASFFPELILQSRPFVDYVVQAEMGEIPFSYIVGKEICGELNEPLGGKEKVYFRDGSKVRSVGFPRFSLSELYSGLGDVPNLELILDDLQIARRNYNAKYRAYHSNEKTPVIINNVRGCGNGKLRCMYCGIYDLSLNVGDPRFFWETVKQYNDEYGVDFFFEPCDSFLSFPKYIKQLIKTKPFDLKAKDIEFEVYARASDVVNIPDAISWLKELNVTRVNLGLDSGDDNMLRFLRKNIRGVSASQVNYEAVRRLAEAGITIHASFPLGPLGETDDSLCNTISFVGRISEDFGYSIATLEASELVPLPNSPAWDILLSRESSMFDFNGGIDAILEETGVDLGADVKEELRGKYDGTDLLDISSLSEDWARYFTHVSFGDIEAAKERIDEIARGIGANCGRAF